ncbi:hypothetical protein BDY21DRAFT_149620 [Lineolata rhizophorae]|uniref:Arrestin C-terminal-like domain-containing protein n=1 Tax=Lineolata rhizophorae TaxID=578093 RepID=A0A6A6NMG4_9PEZI|nr:hypothetical protein BDY21DRAFT_149620 [Lineolata rhizophorae]
MVGTPKVFGVGASKPHLDFRCDAHSFKYYSLEGQKKKKKEKRKKEKKDESLLDSPFVVFHGRPSEAEAAQLTGKLILNNHESMAIRAIHVRLKGLRKISWVSSTTAVSPQQMLHKDVFFFEDCTLFPTEGINKSRPHRLGSGEHEWSFKFTLPGNLPESVEGLTGSYVIYNLSATVDRGMMSKDLTATKHIRVIRTLAADLDESFPMEQINEDVWPDKISYRIRIPRTNYIYGTSITADFLLTPFKKGLTIGETKMELVEHINLSIPQPGANSMSQHHWDIAVARQTREGPGDHDRFYDEEDEESLQDDSYRFRMTLQLPRSLKRCRQHVEAEHVKIEHKLRVYVNLHNPEGHTSQLIVKNIVNLFISPNLPINEDQTVSIAECQFAHAQMHEATDPTAPPMYGEHQLDQIYDEIDTAGFMTPRHNGTANVGGSAYNSGVNTPFYSHSHTGSAENLGSLDAVAASDQTQTTGPGASASALHSRLTTLQDEERSVNSALRGLPQSAHSSGSRLSENSRSTSELSTPLEHGPPQEGYFPTSGQPSRSTLHHSRHSSGHGHGATTSTDGGGEEAQTPLTPGGRTTPGGTQGPLGCTYNMDELARIPSYDTAMRTVPAPRRRGPASGEDLPTYEVATSRPPSPGSGRVSGHASGAVTPVTQGMVPAGAREHAETASRHSGRSNSSDEAPLAPVVEGEVVGEGDNVSVGGRSASSSRSGRSGTESRAAPQSARRVEFR